MTINNVSASGGQYAAAYADETSSVEFTSVAGRLAALVLETQEHQKQVGHEQVALARARFREAVGDEVEALRDQADSAFAGACVEAALGAASGACGVAAAFTKSERSWQGALSTGFGHVAKPLGGVGKNYGAADAKAAQGREEVAKWQMDDARENVNDADALQGKALDWASNVSRDEAATMAAILSNLA
jgi:hypothetical protein